MRAVALLAVVAALACGCDPGPAKQDGPAAAGSSSAAATASAKPASSGAPAEPAVVALTPAQEKQARDHVVTDCVPCHAEELLDQQRLTPKQWAASVKKMQGWGSQLEPAQVDLVVAYLSARYGLSAPPFEPKTVTAAAAEGALAKLPDGPFEGGDAAKGQALYKEACQSCHGETGRGTATGMNLADRPLLFRAAELADVTRKGRGRMPAYPAYKDADIAALIAYLRSLRPG